MKLDLSLIQNNHSVKLVMLTLFLSASQIQAQCPLISVLTSCLDQNLGNFNETLSQDGYIMSDKITLSDGKTVYYFDQDPDKSARVSVTTNPEGNCIRVRLESVYHNCWESFLATANTDAKTYIEKLGPDPEDERLGLYDISGVYRVSGTSRIKGDGNTEISLLVTKI